MHQSCCFISIHASRNMYLFASGGNVSIIGELLNHDAVIAVHSGDGGGGRGRTGGNKEKSV